VRHVWLPDRVGVDSFLKANLPKQCRKEKKQPKVNAPAIAAGSARIILLSLGRAIAEALASVASTLYALKTQTLFGSPSTIVRRDPEGSHGR
jgi:hypothetical protein